MLRDLLTALTTRCSPSIRRNGYLDETLAMRARYRRRAAAWRPHLDNTRRFLLSSAQKCISRNTAVILGSGLLLDVPLEELSRLFQKIILMDVVCLPEIRRVLSKYENVQFIEQDLTGITEQLSRRDLQEFPKIAGPGAGAWHHADLVVSLNLLSQLWVMPRAQLTAKLPGISPDRIDEWCAEIVESHYAFLRSLPCTVCLIADHEQVKRDAVGDVFSRASTVFGLSLPPAEGSWIWNIAPLGTESAFYSRELVVGAWHFSNAECGIRSAE